MKTRENYLSLVKRKGYESVPVKFELCPFLEEYYQKNICKNQDYRDYFNFSTETIRDGKLKNVDPGVFSKYYTFELKPGTIIDEWGVAHEPGSAASMHMTRMRHPLAAADSLEQIMSYPYPDYNNAEYTHQMIDAAAVKESDRIAVGIMACTIWERAWYIRSMEELMMDMMTDDPKAVFLLDKMTEIAICRAESYASAGVDMIHMGDDIGMQKSTMMSESFYCEWIKPRIKKVITAAKAINPEVLVEYHSCGYVVPFIPHLIDVGVDILNPVQPECMNFEKLHSEFGDVLTFSGTIGTQTTMPFGTPDEVRAEVFRNLKIAGKGKGGLLVEPTHMLEPEVPWENIEAYINACKDSGN